MRVLLIANPVAGSGRALEAARRLWVPLVCAGHEVEIVATRRAATETWLDPALASAEAVIVVGGDGAVRLAGSAARRTKTPLYHYPFGTENLFAREFGMDRDPHRLIAALERPTVREIDVGRAGVDPFLIMVSIGYDAEVACDLGERRGSSISHLTYVSPIVREALRWTAARVTLRIDGRSVVEGDRGCLVIGNLRQYALRIDPAIRAAGDDRLLDAVFMPARTSLGAIRWALRARARRHLRSSRVVYRTGRTFEVELDPPCRFQLDGDPPPEAIPVGQLHVALDDLRLPVLLPPPRRVP